MNAGPWTTRLVDAPASDLLSGVEVARLFGFGEDTLDRLVKSGEFPPPVRFSTRTLMYDWRSVAYYRLRCELFRAQPDGKKGADEGH